MSSHDAIQQSDVSIHPEEPRGAAPAGETGKGNPAYADRETERNRQTAGLS